jgi:hypothetical protein
MLLKLAVNLCWLIWLALYSGYALWVGMLAMIKGSYVG